MRISDANVVEILKRAGKLTDANVAMLKEQEAKTGKPLQYLAIKNDIIDETTLTKLYAQAIQIPFVELDPGAIQKDIINRIPEHIARQYNVVLFDVQDDVNFLAMEDPDDVQAIDFLKKYIGANFKLFIATKQNIMAALDQYRGTIGSELNKVLDVEVQQEVNVDEQVSEEEISEDSPIAQTVNLLIEYAVKAGASDIHIEPREEGVQIRYRIDGVLREANQLPRNMMSALVSRIKILSNLKIDERRVPQDGRFKVSVSGKLYALRVSTLPITDGEKVVMRILDESNKALTLEELGYWGHNLKFVNDAIRQPHGMLLVTGPTGSGKSTSLYSVLSILNKPTVNISTVEDPVEYRIRGTNQTQVNPQAGMTFASGLRSLLRQDPNIIMVGEIRDGETADLAVQAALTGHLVFSTLHTNNAATCLPRLLDMGIEPFLIASTIRAVVGQRLVRRLCPDCKEVYAPNEEEMANFKETFKISEETIEHLRTLTEQAAAEGIGGTDAQDTPIKDGRIVSIWRPNKEGCKECGHTGYKGRVGIYEVLPATASVQKLIVSNATSAVIQDEAIKEGMLTMQMDGLVKAMRGLTSIEEIMRVTRE